MFGLGWLEEQQHRAWQRMSRLAIQRGEAVPWSEVKMPKKADLIVIKADTYNPANPLDDLIEAPPTQTVKIMVRDSQARSPEGTWRYIHRLLPKAEPLTIPFKSEAEPARVCFDADVVIPIICTSIQTWMSTTPAEILSCRGGVRFARDRVVIGGLGMGWQLHEIAQKKAVKEIIVVEKSQELVDWYGREMCERYGAKLIVGNIWEEAMRLGRDYRYVIDIWPGWFQARYSRPLHTLRKQGFNIWAWGSPRGGSDL